MSEFEVMMLLVLGQRGQSAGLKGMLELELVRRAEQVLARAQLEQELKCQIMGEWTLVVRA